MLWQCCVCGCKIDDQEDNYESMEVQNEYGRIWHYFHPVCLDDLRTIERKCAELGTPSKTILSKKVVGIRGSWSRQPLHSP